MVFSFPCTKHGTVDTAQKIGGYDGVRPDKAFILIQFVLIRYKLTAH